VAAVLHQVHPQRQQNLSTSQMTHGAVGGWQNPCLFLTCTLLERTIGCVRTAQPRSCLPHWPGAASGATGPANQHAVRRDW
jgi:hypothetical protein